jgi:hypothetical protein
MTPKNVGVRGTKVKVALTVYFKMLFSINNWTTHGPLTFKLYRFIAFGHKMTSMDFLALRGQRSRSH